MCHKFLSIRSRTVTKVLTMMRCQCYDSGILNAKPYTCKGDIVGYFVLSKRIFFLSYHIVKVILMKIFLTIKCASSVRDQKTSGRRGLDTPIDSLVYTRL